MVICPGCKHIYTDQDLLAKEVWCAFCTEKRIIARYREQGFACLRDWEVHSYLELGVEARHEVRKGRGWKIDLWVLPGWVDGAQCLAEELWPVNVGNCGYGFADHREGLDSIVRLALREGGHVVDALRAIQNLNPGRGEGAVREYLAIVSPGMVA